MLVATMLTVVATSCGGGSDEPHEPGMIVGLDDIGVVARFGVTDSVPLAMFLRPLDAAFAGSEIFIVDAAPPWVRVFDRAGRFKRSMVRRGNGPEEVGFPRGIAATADGHLLVVHNRGVLMIDIAGVGAPAVRSQAEFAIRGAVPGCGGDLFVLARRLEQLVATRGDAPGIIARVWPDRTVGDTVMMLGVLRRADSRRLRPAYLERTPRGVALYTEELDHARVIEMDCGGAVTRDLTVDPLGDPEQIVPGWRPGTIGLRGERPPYPGGLVHVDSVFLWAALATDTTAEGVDSITTITAFQPGHPPRRIALSGWLQLFASDSTGMLLLGLADAIERQVLLVDGKALLARMP